MSKNKQKKYEIEIVKPNRAWDFFRITTQRITQHKAEQALKFAQETLLVVQKIIRRSNKQDQRILQLETAYVELYSKLHELFPRQFPVK